MPRACLQEGEGGSAFAGLVGSVEPRPVPWSTVGAGAAGVEDFSDGDGDDCDINGLMDDLIAPAKG